jgi:hypothetical protein
MVSSKSRIFRANQSPFRRKVMRKLWKLGMAVVLALVFAPYALAGITDTPPSPVPPPEPQSTSAIGTVETPPSSAQPGTLTTDPLLDVALNLLQGALSLF